MKAKVGLKVSDVMLEDGTPLDQATFCNNTGIVMRECKFRVMREAVMEAYVGYRENVIYDKTTSDLATFLCRVKKGSRHIRKILSPTQVNNVPHNLVKFADTTDCVFNNVDAPLINGRGKYFLDNSTRTFLFKFHNNTLGINREFLILYIINHTRVPSVI
jgi:hypothetical protein